MLSCTIIEPSLSERNHIVALVESLGLPCRAHACHGEMDPAQGLPDVVLMKRTEETRSFIRTMQRRQPGSVVIVYDDKPSPRAVAEVILEGAAEFMVQPFGRGLLAFKLAQSGVALH
jgi:DNA-binding NtrC family response regulator